MWSEYNDLISIVSSCVHRFGCIELKVESVVIVLFVWAFYIDVVHTMQILSTSLVVLPVFAQLWVKSIESTHLYSLTRQDQISTVAIVMLTIFILGIWMTRHSLLHWWWPHGIPQTPRFYWQLLHRNAWCFMHPGDLGVRCNSVASDDSEGDGKPKV